MPAQRDYYEVLGVARDADGDTIAASYRKLAVRYHPDKNPGDDEATARFKECSEAFEVLRDPEKRSRYDRYGHARRAAASTTSKTFFLRSGTSLATCSAAGAGAVSTPAATSDATST